MAGTANPDPTEPFDIREALRWLLVGAGLVLVIEGAAVLAWLFPQQIGAFAAIVSAFAGVGATVAAVVTLRNRRKP